MTTASPFIPGLELARAFYEEAVRPILAAAFPDLVYSAGLIGTGSEVLGFDTAMSADHNWGPRVTLFLQAADQARLAADIDAALADALPPTFRGYSTHFVTAADEAGTVWMAAAAEGGPIRHRVHVMVLADFLRDYTGADLPLPPTLLDWLLIPEQKLASLARGGVFHDGLGQLAPLQAHLAYYPDEVWRYLMAAQWQRIGQEEAFVGRAGIVGDETGSAIIAARLVQDLMRLCFLQEQQYAPYAKWFGSGFARLAAAGVLGAVMPAILQAQTWRERERHLCQAYTIVARRHNDLGITPPLPTAASPFHDRPFLVIHGERFADALRETITDARVRALPPIGKVEQFVESTDVLSAGVKCRQLAPLYID